MTPKPCAWPSANWTIWPDRLIRKSLELAPMPRNKPARARISNRPESRPAGAGANKRRQAAAESKVTELDELAITRASKDKMTPKTVVNRISRLRRAAHKMRRRTRVGKIPKANKLAVIKANKGNKASRDRTPNQV